jgi:hypothetical protein
LRLSTPFDFEARNLTAFALGTYRGPNLFFHAMDFACMRAKLHRLGFASSIADMGLNTHRLLSLLGCNTGIELGQFPSALPARFQKFAGISPQYTGNESATGWK